jgi:anti-anti-sigma factor
MSEGQMAFQSKSAPDGDRLNLSIEGEVNLEATDWLRNVLVDAHGEAQRMGAKEVVVDLSQLDFLNSSGIKHLVSWLGKVTQLPEESRYRIRLLSSAMIPWQRRSLAALQYFAPNLLTIETVAGST